MEGDVVCATIQTVLQIRLPVLMDEINFVGDFKRDFKKMERSFNTIQDYLSYLSEADMQHVTDKSVKRWLMRLESAAYEADNVLDEFNYQILRNQLDSQKKLEKMVRNFFELSNRIALPRILSREIRDINKRLESINKDAHIFGLQSKIARVEGARLRGAHVLPIRETDSFTVDPIVVGRDDDVSKIVNVLTASSTEDKFSIVPIVGMGGLGKTTLARLVFKDDRVKNHFANNLFWVYVSENFDSLAIFKRILEEIKTEVGIQSREVVLSELGENLRDKRYLLILDDVWSEKPDEWDSFINSLSGISSAKGNAIVLTTRNEKVASIMKTPYVHKLSVLSVENCWSIIKTKVFNKEQEVPMEFEMMGNKIAERCQGLPLAAQVVGGLLWDKSKDDWSSIQHNWLSNFTKGGDIITQILNLSFDNLSSPLLKKCFAYCSLFKKGDRISSTRLVELWMAEGFLQIDGQGDMEATGIKFLNLLLQNSLLQAVTRNEYGDIRYCSMHDLVHDLASHVLGANCNSRNDNILDNTYRVRYIENESTKNDSCLLRQEQAKRLHTLFIRGQVPKKMFFSGFKSLHTLILMGRDIVDLPNLIGTLSHLRFLCVTDTSIKTLPNSIGKLYHLQTLRASCYLERLPNTLTNLISLRHLHIPAIELPPKMGQLASLRTLRYFKVGLEKGCQISNLGRLENLKGELEIHNLERVRDKDEAKSANLFHKVDLYQLKLVWNQWQGGGTNDEDVLESLQPQPNLKSLEIRGFRGTRLSLWASKMAVRDNTKGDWIPFNNLMQIRLICCSKCEEAPTLGVLPNLKFLHFNDLPNVQSLGASFYGDVKRGTTRGGNKKTSILFPMLKRFELSRMPNLIEWKEIGLPTATETQLHEVVAFPCLEYLEINDCRKLRTSPSHFPCLKELIIRRMESDRPLRNICSSIGSLTKLKIARVDELICLPDELFFNNQNFSILSIEDCPNMTSLVPHFVGDKTSLKKLHIWNCPKLENLPDDLHRLSLLEQMLIGNCQKLKLLPYPSGGQSQDFTSLHNFGLIKCSVTPEIQDESAFQPKYGNAPICVTDTKETVPYSPMELEIPEDSIGKMCESVITEGSRFGREIQDESAFQLRYEKAPICLADPNETVSHCGMDVEEEVKDHATATQTDDLGTRVTISLDCNKSIFLNIKLQISSTSSSQGMNSFNLNFRLDRNRDDYEISLTGDHPSLGAFGTSQASVVAVLRHYGIMNRLVSTSMGMLSADEWSGYVVVNLSGQMDSLSLLKEPDCPKLIFLFLQNNRSITSIPPKFFCGMPALRSLDLSSTRIRKLPDSLYMLTKLQVLLLKNCACLDKLQDKVKDLESLEVLDLCGTELLELPEEIGKLTQLRRLQVSFYGPDDESEYIHLPTKLVSSNIISELNELETLSIDVHPEDHRWTKVAGEIIKDVGKLTKLSYLRYYFPTLDTLESFTETSPSWKELRLREFKFVVGQDINRIVSRVPKEVEYKYHEQDRCLTFVNGNNAEEAIQVVLKLATAFYLDHVSAIESLTEFGIPNFKELKFCLVRECPDIKLLIANEESNEGAFSKLEHLSLHYLWELQHIWKDSALPKGSFQMLKHLTVDTCRELLFVFYQSVVPCFSNLEELVVKNCENMKEIIQKNTASKKVATVLPRLKKLVLHHLPELVKLDDRLSASKVPSLDIHCCKGMVDYRNIAPDGNDSKAGMRMLSCLLCCQPCN